MLLPLLGSAAIGGLIGYGTNWLAIRMLFWPLEEKRLFGRKVPFTPGLIPKKRARLATALGDTVASHLVTPETLTSALAAPELQLQMAETMRTAWAAATADDLTVAQLLGENGAFSMVDQVADHVWASLQRALRRTGKVDGASQALDAISPALLGAFREQFARRGPDGLRQALVSLRDDQTWRAAFDGMLLRASSAWEQQSAPLGQFMPEDIRDELRQLILERAPDWLDRLREALETEASRNVIKGLLRQVLTGSPMLKLAAAFVDQDRLARALPALLEKEEIRSELSNLALSWLDRTWQMPVSSALVALFPDGVTAENVRTWSDRLIRGAMQFNFQRHQPGQAYSSDRSASADETGRLLQPLAPLLHEIWQETLADQGVQAALRTAFDQLLARLLATPVRSLLPQVSAERFSVWSVQLCRWLTNLAERHGQSVLVALRLPQVVEEQVNRMNIVEVEEILLRVMREQLRAITNLGFLLGAAVGLILPSFNAWLASL